jgi:protease I
MPLPSQGFDQSETRIPWREMIGLRHTNIFATPDGQPGIADTRMVTGQGLGLLAPILRADNNGRAAHDAMIASSEILAAAVRSHSRTIV